jgi:transcriptional accessory protein Tex/SPT6
MKNLQANNKKKSSWMNLLIYLFTYRFMAGEIFNHPVIRKWLRKLYFEKATIFTEPSEKGKKELDLNSPYYIVKRIVRRPIKTFNDELWIMVNKCEKMGLIKSKIVLPWDEGYNTDAFKKTTGSADEISDRLKKMTLAGVNDKKSQENDNIIQWNILRTEVIKNLLKDFVYPSLEKELRNELFERAGKPNFLN